jgi:predicted DNA-binding protein (MmcQ/YjbR family)
MTARKSGRAGQSGPEPRAQTAAFARLIAFALTFPETVEEHPWGETAIKVCGKIFVFLGGEGLTVKLPCSYEFALAYPFARPAPRGPGKGGWISVRFAPGQKVPQALLKAWIEESYRAIAPKRLVTALPPD